MKASTLEWIKKAEADYQIGLSLMRRRKVPAWDHACFCFQQAAEKYIKGRLEEAGVRFPKIHDIAALLQVAASVQPPAQKLRRSGSRQTSDGRSHAEGSPPTSASESMADSATPRS